MTLDPHDCDRPWCDGTACTERAADAHDDARIEREEARRDDDWHDERRAP